MHAQSSFLTRRRWAIPFGLGLVIALGSLTALAADSTSADEDSKARAAAGDRDRSASGPLEASEPPTPTGAAADTTILDIAQDSALFSRFEQAIEQAGMDDVLEEDGPFTLFLPTNAAFDALPDDQRQALRQDPQALADLVSNHVARARLGITDLMQTEQIDALSGETLELSTPAARLSIGGAEILRSDLVAGNGVVHVIDRVIL
ncbi:MAG: fasciclin domain-containing protein [Halochromatium sp.]